MEEKEKMDFLIRDEEFIGFLEALLDIYDQKKFIEPDVVPKQKKQQLVRQASNLEKACYTLTVRLHKEAKQRSQRLKAEIDAFEKEGGEVERNPAGHPINVADPKLQEKKDAHKSYLRALQDFFRFEQELLSRGGERNKFYTPTRGWMICKEKL